MSQVTGNPRSVLHALIPLGDATPEQESLTSYLCRLAVSHAVSTVSLSRSVARRAAHEVAPHFDWHQRQLSGLRDAAHTWSAILSAQTSVDGLDRLTFLRWRQVIAQNGLSIHSKGQYCPACFESDSNTGGTPYFRLAWEPTEVTHCARHGTPLQRTCPHCGKDNIRHAAAYVVPGWCTSCGEFLGMPGMFDASVVPNAQARWKALQVAELVSLQVQMSKEPNRDELIAAIRHLIAKMDNGKSAAFAKRVGVAKSTIHHWLNAEGTPTLDASLKIASQTGLSLANLLSGDVEGWSPPSVDDQLVLALPQPATRARAVQRDIDWEHIESELLKLLVAPTPISVLEAARRLNVEARQLYLRANCTTRKVGERWKAYLQRRQQEHVVQAWPYLEQACIELAKEGRAVTRRAIYERVPREILNPIENLLDVLKDVQAHLSISST